MQRLTYYFLRFFIFLFSILPFSWLYKLSDGLRYIFFYVIKYRYTVIKGNLERSFPEKSGKEIQELIWGAYGNLCDVLLEGIKGWSLSDEECIRRYRFLNPEILDDLYNNGKSVLILAAHYGNWEWAPQAIGLQLKHHTLGIAAPIKNPYVNHYIQKARAFKNVSIATMKETAEAFKKFKDQPTAYVFIMDQSPSKPRNAHWVHFLNQKTACLRGGDTYARRTGYPVLCSKQKRVARGFYEITLEILEEHPAGRPEGKITELYMNHLEEMVLLKPEDWLWSHRRWKHHAQ